MLALECDVGDEAAVEASFARTVETLGHVDGCFANAGVSGRSGGKPFFEMAAEEWRRVMRVNPREASVDDLAARFKAR